MKNNGPNQFGTFEGVFTPTILTIIGVIMYLRLGWVVGNAGLGGAILIILLAKLVTITTALALSSMATNIKIGAGGAYALVSRSLGVEVGSAIGIPLYLSQALGAAMYITGFTECWLSIFPTHNSQIISSLALLGLLTITIISTKAAMKAQYFIMGIIVISLVSFFLGKGDGKHEIVMWGSFEQVPFWDVFAIFFPAVTGITAGAAMSGDLKDPQRSLPIGILSAVATSLLIYLAAAFWFDYTSSSDLLINNFTLMADVSRWKILVIAGIIGATLSSALGSIIGGPRTLLALGQDKVIPFSKYFAKLSKNGEPQIALIFTSIVIEVNILYGDLNSIAPLLTMFTLLTYLALNLAVFIEKAIGIPSFRPTFKIPLFIPLIGAIWCLAVMFLINATFAATAIFCILVIYTVQVKRELDTPWGDVGSALFCTIAEWAAKTSAQMPQHAKSWKPNLIVPVENPKEWFHLMNFVRDIVFPSGTLRIFSVIPRAKDESLFRRKLYGKSHEKNKLEQADQQLKELVSPLKKEGIFTVEITVDSDKVLEGINIISQVLKGAFFPPNLVFLTMSGDIAKDKGLGEIISIYTYQQMGILILYPHPKAGFGKNETINVWYRVGSQNLDLLILIALQLFKNWHADLRLITVIERNEKKDEAIKFLDGIIHSARIPASAEKVFLSGTYQSALKAAPLADLNIFGFSPESSIKMMHSTIELVEFSCLFVMESGYESFEN